MRLSSPLPSLSYLLIWIWTWSSTMHALVTLQTIRDLTNTTDECRAHIVALGKVQEAAVIVAAAVASASPDPLIRALGGVPVVKVVTAPDQVQVVLGGGGDEEEKDEVELTVAAALRFLCSNLLIELEKPLLSKTLPAPEEPESAQCQATITEFHAFLEATVKFLHEVQERQMYWQWKSDSGVFDGVGWMQSLWASRRSNSQDRSFIEQQMAVYGATGCFGKSKEVLRRDVEVVEYLNDLIDSFY